MWRLMVPKARHMVALAIFVPLLLVLLHVVARHTDPYEAAEQFLMSDARVAESVGSVARVDFKFWDGFHFASSSNGGEANFTFDVSGSKRVSTIEVHLRSSSGVWRVVIAEVRSSNGETARIVGAAERRGQLLLLA